MTWFIKHFARFWAVKRAIIKAVLFGMSDTAKELLLKEVIASQLPDYCIGHRPYKKNPKRRDNQQAEIITQTMNTDGQII